MDIFVHNRVTGITERVSVSNEGIQASDDSSYPAISADGRFVSFKSYASDLLPNDNGLYTNDIFLRDRNP